MLYENICCYTGVTRDLGYPISASTANNHGYFSDKNKINLLNIVWFDRIQKQICWSGKINVRKYEIRFVNVKIQSKTQIKDLF